MTVCARESKNRKILKVNIIIYFLFLLKAGFFFNEQYTRFTAPLYLLLILFLNGSKVLVFSKNKITLFLIYVILLFSNYVMNGFPELVSIASVMLNMLTALLISNVVSEEDFCDSFRHVIFAMCLASIVGFVIMYFFKSASAIFPALVNSNDRIGRFAVLAILSDYSNAGMQRAQGIFWEPGAFQAMIVFATVLEIYKTRTLTYKRMAVYALTILLTFSTTGYVCLMLLIVLAINKQSKTLNAVKSILIFGALLLVYFSMQSEANSFLQYTMFGKIRMILNYQEGVSTHASSRVDSVLLPLRFFFRNPIFGIGKSGYQEMAKIAEHTMFTCTPINYLVQYGIVLGGLSYWGMYRFFAKESIAITNGIILALCLLLSISTEQFALNPILTCMIMYGFGNRQNKLDNSSNGQLLPLEG